jgi:hypothetical protein
MTAIAPLSVIIGIIIALTYVYVMKLAVVGT